MILLRRLLPFGLFGALACLFLWQVVFAGRVFVPAGLLHYLVPWTSESRPPWNPLMYDSVGQFYPWRHFAAETVRSGTLPLWNPYQFCGTPFVANSQSAVFYPGNFLFYLLPTAYAAGWSVILHLSLAGGFTYLFLRARSLSAPSAALGGIAYAFSTWQVSWLHLPTFLATSCWLPLVLHLTLKIKEEPTIKAAAQLALAIGMTLLAGHLQIAFYALLAAGLLALWPRTGRRAIAGTGKPLRVGALWLSAVLAGMLLSMPQLLPSLELSKRSHRAAPASTAGYESYVGYSLPSGSLVTLALPDFFGNQSNPDNPYVGKSKNGSIFNYAEGAMYVGLATLILAAVALLEARRRSPLVGYAAVLAGLAMLMALGTWVDWLLYFYVPGFSQSGSPGRALVLWTFGLSTLAAFGCEEVVSGRLCNRGLTAGIGLAALALGLCLAAAVAGSREMSSEWPSQAIRAGVLFLITSVIISLAARPETTRTRFVAAARAALPVLLSADLFAVGMDYNPTSTNGDVYPETPLISSLKQQSGHDRIAPINNSFSFSGPSSILPPNGATVFRLRDVQGYDSLFPGEYKALMDEIAAPLDPQFKSSPLQVGNMVFAKNPFSPLLPLTGTRLIISKQSLVLPGSSYVEGVYISPLPGATGRARVEGGALRWVSDDVTRVELECTSPAASSLRLADQLYPGWVASIDGVPTLLHRSDRIFRSVDVPAGTHRVTFSFRPASFQVGLYLSLILLSACVGCLLAFRSTRERGGS